MKLEEEIKQTKFKDIFQKAALNIIFTANWLELRSLKAFKPFGLSSQQYNVLRILRGSNPRPLNLSDIQERMMDKMSNATRLVEKLRQKGLLTRHECPSNRRKVEIAITQKGLDLLAEIDPVLDKHHKEEGQKITPEEAAFLSDILDKLRS
jgi:DNA-binding MarR family transcriptional regulator